MKPVEILDELEKLYPDAWCELVHRNAYELTIAVLLSAQTTDISVNKVTPVLFEKYPSVYELAQADLKDVEAILKSLGLYRNKSKNIILLAKQVIESFGGIIPDNQEDLMTLAGIGRKSANVVVSCWYGVPAIAVDTHVSRVSKRLRLAYANDDVEAIERKLNRKFPKQRWSKAHHTMIFFGRYRCKAKKPECLGCPFTSFCREYPFQKYRFEN